MTSVSKNVFIDKLEDIVKKYNNNSTIKMKPVYVKSNTYINSGNEINNKDPKFRIGDIVKISKHKIFLEKVPFQFGLKKVLLLKKSKTLCRGHMLLVISKVKKLLKHSTKKRKKTNQKEFRVEKVIKRKGEFF